MESGLEIWVSDCLFLYSSYMPEIISSCMLLIIPILYSKCPISQHSYMLEDILMVINLGFPPSYHAYRCRWNFPHRLLSFFLPGNGLLIYWMRSNSTIHPISDKEPYYNLVWLVNHAALSFSIHQPEIDFKGCLVYKLLVYAFISISEYTCSPSSTWSFRRLKAYI